MIRGTHRIHQSLSLATLRSRLDSIKRLRCIHRDAASDGTHRERLERALWRVAHPSCVLGLERVVRAHPHG